MVIFLVVLPFLDPKHCMASKMFMSPFAFPNTTFAIQPLSPGSADKKSWEPLVSGPTFAMDQMPEPVYFRIKFSSPIFSLLVELPPVPFWHMMSLPCYMSPGMSLWKEKPYTQTLALQCSEHESFMLSLGPCLKTAERKHRHRAYVIS